MPDIETRALHALSAEQDEAGRRQLEEIARKLIWWTSPGMALKDRRRFVAQVMVLGTWNDVQIVRRLLCESAFRNVLAAAPAGVFDARSWSYWHHYFRCLPVPPLPVRRLTECSELDEGT